MPYICTSIRFESDTMILSSAVNKPAESVAFVLSISSEVV